MCDSLLLSPIPLQPRLERPSPEGDKNIKIKLFYQNTDLNTHVYTRIVCTHTGSIMKADGARRRESPCTAESQKALVSEQLLYRWKESHVVLSKSLGSSLTYFY
ncbi:hypothetical protein XENOCAPTIV_020008 [Xenoophorus captivus]|uniref:Uncharacterized protein n=1 Tax=Xenoophorus captivus TaxID=1517983 RepID=A0ABV0QDU0_9TELE